MAATPLRSIRLSDETWAALDEYAAKHGLKGRAEAIDHALNQRQAADRAPVAVPIAHTPTVQPVASAPMPRVGTGRPADFGPRVDVSKLDVPLASEVRRLPMQRVIKASRLGDKA